VSAAPDPSVVDTKSLISEIMRRAAGDQSSWPDAGQLASLAIGAPSTVERPARDVLDASLRRQNVRAARRVIAEAETLAEASTIAPAAVTAFTAVRDSRPTSARLTARSLGEIVDDASLAEYDWLIPGLLESGDRLIVTGEEGWGKSVLLRQLVVLPAAGLHPFRLKPIPNVKCLVIDCENSERQWHRKVGPLMRGAGRMGSQDVRDYVQVVATGRLDITSSADLAEVHRLLDEHDPRILLIGPLYKLVPKAVTNDDDAAPLITALDSLRERGIALLMEAHAAHAGTNGQDWRPRGSRALMGWPEFGLGLGRNRDNPTKVADVHRWRGDRDERDWPVDLFRGGALPCWLSGDPADTAARERLRIASDTDNRHLSAVD